MSVERNVGGLDRWIRGAAAVVFAAVAARALLGGERTAGLLAGAVALGLGFNAVTCFCGINRALGIDTTE